MPDASDSIMRGVEAGLSRCRENNLLIFVGANEAGAQVRAQALGLVQRFGLGRWSPRGLEIIGELITVALVSRRRYNEPALTADEIALFAWGLSSFLNSWFHE